MDKIIESSKDNLLHVYNRFPVVFERGKGTYLYDINGKEYLDFASGIGVMAFGFGDEEYTKAVKSQMDKLIHTSNLYYTKPLIDAAELACCISKMDKVFFTNSGAEAVEGALKVARKYAYLKGKPKGEVIAMESSFHGRTMGALSVTGNSHYREAFYPLVDKVSFANFNDFSSVEALVNDNTCAIILEPIQGEGGIIPCQSDFIKKVRAICDERDILLIFDEIQCGLCRTGYYYYWQKLGVKPDILLSAKALGAGIPVGAFFVTDKVAKNSLVPGDHGTTYGGNPLATAAVYASLSIMEKRDLCAHVREVAPYLEEKLEDLIDGDLVLGRRGVGFMQGLILKNPVGDVVRACLDAGLVVLSAGGNVLRLLPPLITGKKEIDKMCEILREVLYN